MKSPKKELDPRQRGRPAYEPTDKDKKQVLVMSGIGLTHDQIAKVLSISDETLRKYYSDELETGVSRMNAQVAQNLFTMATGSGSSAVSAAIFWMKTRAQWREKTQIDIKGTLDVDYKVIDASVLDMDQREAVRQALYAALEAPEGEGEDE